MLGAVDGKFVVGRIDGIGTGLYVGGRDGVTDGSGIGSPLGSCDG